MLDSKRVAPLYLGALGVFFASLLCCGCGGAKPQSTIPTFVATVPPVGMILKELTRGRAEVVTLVSGAASPHTYEPRPSDARAAGEAKALFYVADGLDGWAAKLPTEKRIALIDFVPREMLLPGDVAEAMHDHDAEDHEHGHGDGHDHGDTDPHIWSDPRVVAAMLPGLVSALSECDPEGAAQYAAAAERFRGELEALDAALAAELSPVKGRPVILFHLSLQYFLKRYDLRLAAVVESSPGKEATPKYLEQVIAAVKEAGAKVVFSEPQLAKRPAEAVAEAAGVALAELDPYGGLPGRETYAELLRYNAGALRTALEK